MTDLGKAMDVEFMYAIGGVLQRELRSTYFIFHDDDFKRKFHLEVNTVDMTLTYSDYRNRMYGLVTVGDLVKVLELVGNTEMRDKVLNI